MIKMVLIGLGIAGIIAFFPFNFDNTYTCLAHRYVKGDNSTCCGKNPEMIHSDQNHAVDSHSGASHHLMQHYLVPFAFLWWTSIGIVFLQVRNLARQRKRLKSRHKGNI